MFGPKFAARSEKVTPWAHALFGVAQLNAVGQNIVGDTVRESDTWFAWAVGGGLDVNLHKRIALRVVQADYVRVNGRAEFNTFSHGLFISTGGGSSNNLRVSFGVVLRLGGD